VIYFDRLMERAIESIPPCPGEALLRSLVLSEARRLVPSEGPAGVSRREVPKMVPAAHVESTTGAQSVREH